jgi:hypothetical protein
MLALFGNFFLQAYAKKPKKVAGDADKKKE